MRISLNARFFPQDIFNIAMRSGLSRDVAGKLSKNVVMANIDVDVSPDGGMKDWKLTGIGVLKGG